MVFDYLKWNISLLPYMIVNKYHFITMRNQLGRSGLRSVNHMVWLITTPENEAHSPLSQANTGLRLMVPSLHLGLGRVEKRNSLQLGSLVGQAREFRSWQFFPNSIFWLD